MTQLPGPTQQNELATALERTRPTLRCWRTWAHREPALAGLSWGQFRHVMRHGPSHRQDELLTALVRVAQEDEGAVGVVAACLLPGLRARIARHAPGLPSDEAWAIAAEGLCSAILSGPPSRYIANRLLDAAKRHLQRAVGVERRWRCETGELPAVPTEGSPSADEPSAAFILRTAIGAGVLSRADAWLLHSTRIVGHSLALAADQLGINYETTKKRRLRAQGRLRRWWTGTPSCPRRAA